MLEDGLKVKYYNSLDEFSIDEVLPVGLRPALDRAGRHWCSSKMR